MESVSLSHKTRNEAFKATMHPEVSQRIADVDFEDVKKLEFISRISLKSLLWSLAFFVLFLDLCLRRNPDNWFFSSIVAIAAGLGILAIIIADRKHYIFIYMNDGSKLKLAIAKDNKREAGEFVELVNKKMT